MTLTERYHRIDRPKFSFGKSTEYSPGFAVECDAFSMHQTGFGLGISDQLTNENQLRAIFLRIMEMGGIFLFNISGVNLKRAKRGFNSYSEAEGNHQITEWELSQILNNRDYLINCNFHNGKVEFKKTKLWNSIR